MPESADGPRIRELEQAMSEEVPHVAWEVRRLHAPKFGRARVLVSAGGTTRIVPDLSPKAARELAHEIALALRLKGKNS